MQEGITEKIPGVFLSMIQDNKKEDPNQGLTNQSMTNTKY